MQETKVAILLPANVWFCPFVNIYTHNFDKYNIKNDIINWDKSGNENTCAYSYKGHTGNSSLSKLLGYWKFSRFVKKALIQGHYDRIIVFSSQIGIFCSLFLKKYYQSKYIFDFRDLSIEQYSFMRRPFLRLLNNSYANVISSPGFKKCLPKGIKYYISHNFVADNVLNALAPKPQKLPQDPISVLTIGGIRIDANPQIIEALGNKSGIKLDFVGRGAGANTLKDIVNGNDFKNVFFEGYYDKEEEGDIIEKATFLNIFYPDWISHKTAMSNRFYNSLIYKRPMIVTKGQIQGDYCEKYNVGLAIDTTIGLDQKLKDWLKNTNMEEYQGNCIRLLKVFLKDDNHFKSMLQRFLAH